MIAVLIDPGQVDFSTPHPEAAVLTENLS